MSFFQNLSAKLPFRKKDDYGEEELFETLSPEDQEIQNEFLNSPTEETPSAGWEEETQEIPVLDAEIEPPKKKRGLAALLSRLPKPKTVKPERTEPSHPKPSMQGGQRQQILLLLILLVLLAILAFFLFGGSRKQASQPAAPASTTEHAASDTDTDYANTDRMFINPFVDRTQLSNIAKDSNGNLDINASHNTVSAQRTGALPAIPGGSYSSNPVYANVPRMGALPAIPSVSPSSVPPVSRPSAPPSSAPSHASSSVSGVMTGGDGNGMAIMSDGTVLSAGDTYNDGRIAYIGGDGIHFDDGSTMKYGE